MAVAAGAGVANAEAEAEAEADVHEDTATALGTCIACRMLLELLTNTLQTLVGSTISLSVPACDCPS